MSAEEKHRNDVQSTRAVVRNGSVPCRIVGVPVAECVRILVLLLGIVVVAGDAAASLALVWGLWTIPQDRTRWFDLPIMVLVVVVVLLLHLLMHLLLDPSPAAVFPMRPMPPLTISANLVDPIVVVQ